MERAGNNFTELNTDVSDFALQPNQMRMAKNVRLISLDSSTYAISNIKGTDNVFSLTSGFEPLAVKSYNEIVYILSFNNVTNSYELGSYPSPDYATQTPGVVPDPTNYNSYRPFNNLIPSGGGSAGPLSFQGKWAYGETEDVKMEIQPEYDSSVNVLLFAKGRPPRIVNSAFAKDSNSNLIVLESRQGAANSNTYTLDSLDKETRLILRSDKILKINFGSIPGGGRLLAGNYQYLFTYQTEDFASTDIIGESSICQVFFGNIPTDIRGGDQSTETSKKVILNLSNVDVDFKYLKVYFKYSSGTDVETTNWYELDRPIEITGTSFNFEHTGYEDTSEVSEADLIQNYVVVESANSGTQINGYLLIGGIKGPYLNFTNYQSACQLIQPQSKELSIPFTGNFAKEGYNDPENTYNHLGYMSGETYPFGIVFIMLDGSLSPVFPVRGFDFYTGFLVPGDPSIAKGLIRFKDLEQKPFYDTANKEIDVKYLEADMTAFMADNGGSAIVDSTLGFFFVRGERKADAISQGIMIPVSTVPPIEYNRDTGQSSYYSENRFDTDYTNFRFMPCLDGFRESFQLQEKDVNNDVFVLNNAEGFSVNYGGMPITLLDPAEGGYNGYPTGFNPLGIGQLPQVQVFPYNKWAYYPGEILTDEPGQITNLQRDSVYIRQWYKQNHVVSGDSLSAGTGPTYKYGGGTTTTGFFYDFVGYANYIFGGYTSAQGLNPVETIRYIPGETLQSGDQFVSRMYAEVKLSSDYEYKIKSSYRSYFGLDFGDNILNYPADYNHSVNNPIGANKRYVTGRTPGYMETIGTYFDNYGKTVPASFLVSIYPQNGPVGDIDTLYPTVDGISYRQCTPRYSWNDVPQNGKIQIFGGDTYIVKAYMRLNRSGYDSVGTGDLANIDQGVIVSWIQESQSNLALRTTYRDGEGLRSFYPYEKESVLDYRKYRLQETDRYSGGYSETDKTKPYFKIDSTSPFVQSDLYSRVYHSTRHVPNTFKNGYREITGTSFQDYDVDMGRIVHLDNYRNRMQVIFEHGIGIGEINERIQTASDASGAIFVQPDQVLPPTLGFASKDIGTQHPRSILRAPSGLYGVDREKKKIWRFADQLEVISDQQISSWLESIPFSNPVTGYNPKYNEVLFTSDDGWTLCFHEGLQKFTSFYSFVPDLYTTMGRNMISIKDGVGWQHDSNTTMNIYGNLEDCYVEFVVNKDVPVTKVYDYINIISNEVRPLKIEFFNFTEENKHFDVLNTAGMGQYSRVDDDVNPYTGENNIRFRDKKFVAQIPESEFYSSLEDQWAAGGRMRNKYLIIRLTYNTTKKLQLLSVITTFRYSAS